MVCMDRILDKLFLGGITGTFNPAYLHEKGITHILSLMDRPLPEELVGGFKYKHVYALDLYDTDLLQDLEACLDFVEEGRRKGGVLVHCQAGSSRSATVVIAYVMRTCAMNRLSALQFVKQHRSIVNPNEGFLRQLELFEIMGCRVDQSHEEFRRYMLSKVAVRSKSGFSSELPISIYRSETAAQPASETQYRCRKCRRTLFHSDALMVHGKGQGESAFDWRSKVPASQQQVRAVDDDDDDDDNDGVEDGEPEKCEVSLFVEPIAWMRGQIETVEGKLACPKCKAKLGSFVWYGERCPCGAWVAPAFHIQTSKVDAMKPRNIPLANQVVAPPLAPCPVPQPQSSADQQETMPTASVDVPAPGDVADGN